MESQEEKLQHEILDGANAAAEKVKTRARGECERALHKAEKENLALREKRLEEAGRQAEQKASALIQGLESEKRRLWLQEREECISGLMKEVYEQALALKAGSAERKASLLFLLQEAVDALKISTAVVSVAPDDEELLPSQMGECRLIVKGTESVKGGVIVSSEDGLLVYDNSFAGRMRRMRDDFRQMLA